MPCENYKQIVFSVLDGLQKSYNTLKIYSEIEPFIGPVQSLIKISKQQIMEGFFDEARLTLLKTVSIAAKIASFRVIDTFITTLTTGHLKILRSLAQNGIDFLKKYCPNLQEGLEQFFTEERLNDFVVVEKQMIQTPKIPQLERFSDPYYDQWDSLPRLRDISTLLYHVHLQPELPAVSVQDIIEPEEPPAVPSRDLASIAHNVLTGVDLLNPDPLTEYEPEPPEIEIKLEWPNLMTQEFQFPCFCDEEDDVDEDDRPHALLQFYYDLFSDFFTDMQYFFPTIEKEHNLFLIYLLSVEQWTLASIVSGLDSYTVDKLLNAEIHLPNCIMNHVLTPAHINMWMTLVNEYSMPWRHVWKAVHIACENSEFYYDDIDAYISIPPCKFSYYNDEELPWYVAACKKIMSTQFTIQDVDDVMIQTRSSYRMPIET
ncbi:hypothetical protein 3 [Hubei picorna-like virus 69]|uniref:hypothetical protein 3 n=1 Tax=Hubei picorna-like virus 69 TaxID=1923152 RepID=UPI000909553C|nr:hypothetical protein 3 [Hubei picorna-like virus 69]APG78386.1 hypothetical protein 3 [Hubei picorna-like virus 69]